MTSAGSCMHRLRGMLWPGDHDGRQAEFPCREEFAKCRVAATVLGHDHLDQFFAQEIFLRFNREWAAPQDDAMARQAWSQA